jgi:glycosyltransferase involved in cell wall biosynthesis
MKRILQLCNYTWETGGPPSVIYSHAKVQIEHNIEQHIYSTPLKNQNNYSLCSNQRLFVFKRSFFAKILPDFSWELFIAFFKNRYSFDFVISHGLWNFGSILPYIIPNNAKKIVTLHGFLDDYVLGKSVISKKIFWFFIQKWCLKKADCIHVISTNELEFVKTNFPFLSSKLVYIPNGIAIENNLEEIDSNFKANLDQILIDSDILFLFLGRLNKKKGLDLLIPAFAEFQSKYNLKAKLLIVGPDDGYKVEVEKLIIRIEEDENTKSIHLLDSVKNAEKSYILEKCNVFILPSYSEGFSIAALEAIGNGIPGIYSNTIGFSDDIKEYQAGLICDLNTHSIVDKMLEITLDSKLRDTISSNGLKLFKDKFQIETVGNQYINQILTQ